MTALTNLKPGDVLIGDDRSTHLSDYMPRVDRLLYLVVRLTATQAVCHTHLDPHRSGIEVRVRLSDGALINSDSFRRSVRVATPIDVAEHEAQVAARAAYREAMAAVDDLVDVPLHRLKLSLRQIEALAQAWHTIKIMKG